MNRKRRRFTRRDARSVGATFFGAAMCWLVLYQFGLFNGAALFAAGAAYCRYWKVKHGKV